MAKFKKTQVEIEGKWQERETLVETDALKRWGDDVNLKTVGQPLTRVDGFERVSGAAEYTYDVQLPGMLFGKILRSSVPHARIKDIDISAAKELPGVRFILTNETIGDLLRRGHEFSKLLQRLQVLARGLKLLIEIRLFHRWSPKIASQFDGLVFKRLLLYDLRRSLASTGSALTHQKRDCLSLL